MAEPSPTLLSLTLPNGLRTVVTHLPSAHRVALALHLCIGSRYETPRNNGISHLLEHMLYRGIPAHPTAHEQALAFETLGGTLVAATGTDSGTLAISCPPENFEPTLRLFASVYREPVLDGLAIEKRIVKEEILEDLDAEGTLIDDYDLLRATAFEGHPLGLPVIGTVERIDPLTVTDLGRHHAEHYVAAGTAISVAGPLPPDTVARQIEEHFGGAPGGAVSTIAAPGPPRGPSIRFVRSASSQTTLRIGFRAPGSSDSLAPATEILLRILDDGNSTRLYRRLCDERGLVYDVSAGYEASDDAGLFDVACGAAHEESRTVLAEILDVLRRVRDGGPEASELEKAKARYRWSLAEMLDSPGAFADFLADATLRRQPLPLAERAARMDAVTRDSVSAAAGALLRPEKLSAVLVGVPSRRSEAALRDLIEKFA